MTVSFAEIAEQVQRLAVDEKEELLELIHAWIIEQRREEFALNAQSARDAHAAGSVKHGNIDDLMADMYAED